MTIAVAIEVAASDIAYRLGAFNTNPILLARATGFALLLLCLLYWMERIRLWVFLAAGAVVCFGLLESASRGPLVAFIITAAAVRSEEHTSELQSLMRISYAVLCLKKKKYT